MSNLAFFGANAAAAYRIIYATMPSAFAYTFFGAGYNFSGQLGLGDNVASNSSFRPVSGNFDQVACASTTTLAISAASYKMFSTGNNFYGQQGQGDNTNRNLFTPLTGEWQQVRAGGVHVLALSAETKKWFGTGRNVNGQLALGDTDDRNAFAPLTGEWDNVVCGSSHTMAQSAGTNRWFGTGYNDFGQLGLGDSTQRNSFTPLTGNWEQMVCGAYHTLALSAGTNQWFGTGYNDYGQLGLGNSTSVNTFAPLTGNWQQMVCGGYHTLALSAGTNKWFSTGYNSEGQLALGDAVLSNRNTLTPIQGEYVSLFSGVESNSTFARKASGQFQLIGLPLSAQWERGVLGANEEMVVACYVNSVVNTASADFIRTTDGTNYVFAQRLPTIGWTTLDYGNGIYLSRSSIASRVATSTNGTNWNTYSNSTAGIQNGTFGLSATFTTTGGAFTFVPAFWSGNLRFSQTQNGIDFTVSSVGSWTGSYTVGGIGYGNNRYVVPKANSTDVMIISAGFGSASIQAESKSLPSVSNWSQVAYGNGIFLVISDDSTAGAISSDNGNTWSSVTLPAFNDSSYFGTKVIFGGGRFFAVGGSNSAIAAFSTDGQTWTTKNLPVTGGWTAPAYYNRKYVTFLKNSNVGAYIEL